MPPARSEAASSSKQAAGKDSGRSSFTPGVPAQPAGGFPPLSNKDLGVKLSVLYRIHGDEKYPYSEAVGVLQRVEARPEGGPVYHLARRRGDVVAVPAYDILKLRLLDGG